MSEGRPWPRPLAARACWRANEHASNRTVAGLPNRGLASPLASAHFHFSLSAIGRWGRSTSDPGNAVRSCAATLLSDARIAGRPLAGDHSYEFRACARAVDAHSGKAAGYRQRVSRIQSKRAGSTQRGLAARHATWQFAQYPPVPVGMHYEVSSRRRSGRARPPREPALQSTGSL